MRHEASAGRAFARRGFGGVRRFFMGGVLLFAVGSQLGGCAPQSSPRADTAAVLKGRRLTMAVRNSPPFDVPTTGTSSLFLLQGFVGALLISAVQADIGERIARANALADPSLTVARELGSGISARYGLAAPPTVIARVDDDPTRVVLTLPTADLVLDFRTVAWGIFAFPERESKQFKVAYTVDLRLIDLNEVRPLDGRSGAVLAEATCSRDSKRAAASDALFADHARQLKAELATVARLCAKELGSTIFAMNSQR